MEEFAYRPETGEREGADDGVDDDVVYPQHGNGQPHDAGNEEEPPIAGAGVVFGFDDNGVEQPDKQKCGCSDDEAFEVECVHWDVADVAGLLQRDRYFLLDALVERDEGFGAAHFRYGMDMVFEKFHQVLVVVGINLYYH